MALAEIRRYQKTTNLLIPRAPFFRLVGSFFAPDSINSIFKVRSVANVITSGKDLKFQANALYAIQVSSIIFTSTQHMVEALKS